MKLDFILGDTISCATVGAIEEISKLAEDKQKQVVVLVPENCSLMVEKLVLEKCGATSNIRVYSFVRLLEKVDNSKRDKYISKENAILIIKKIVLDNFSKLVCFKKSAKSIGFAEMIYETIEQFKASRVSAYDIEQIEKTLPPRLKIKMQDILLIYKEYEKFIGEAYLDNCDKLQYLNDTILNSDFLNDSYVYVVGFDNLTSQGAEFIATLSKISLGVKVACSYIQNDGSKTLISDNEMFEKLKGIADKYGIIYNPKVVNTSRKPVFQHLAKNLFSYPYKTMENDGSIKLYEGLNPRDEVAFVCSQILTDIETKKMLPQEIAIVCNDIGTYESFLKTELGDRALPYYINKQHSLVSHPLVKLVLKFFDCYRKGYDASDVLELGKNILLEHGADFDLFENYCLKHGVSRMGFFKPFEYEMQSQNFAKIEGLRVKFAKKLQYFDNLVKNARLARDYVVSIKKLFEMLNIKTNMNALYDVCVSLDPESAEITRQAFDKLAGILDGVDKFLGDCECSVDDFYGILSSGAEAVSISCLPLFLSSISITSDILSISPRTKSVYILGALDGVVPLRQDDCGIIVDSEIGSLSETIEKKIEPTIRAVNKRERFKIYNLLLVPTDKIVLSYPAFSVKGEESKPSSLIASIGKLFTENGKQMAVSNSASEFGGNAQSLDFGAIRVAEKTLIEMMQNAKEQKYVNYTLMNTIYFAIKDFLSPEARRIIDNFNIEPEAETLHDAEGLFFANKNVSISELEKYFACPLAHFLVYGLGAKEKERGTVRALDVGNILHLVAEKFVKIINTINTQNLKKTVERILNDAIAELEIPSKNNALVLNLISGEAQRLCAFLLEEKNNSDFVSEATELPFGRGEKAVSFRNGIKLVGKIDRVDVYGDYVKVIDYKTGDVDIGPEDVYFGRKIQLISYLLAIDNYRKLKNVAVLYFPIHNKFADSKRNAEFMFRNNGLVVDDMNVIRSIDKSLSLENPQSKILKVELKTNKDALKEGVLQLKNSSNLVSYDTLEGLKKYVYNLSDNAIGEILDGYITPTPILRNGVVCCKYCPMAQTCGVKELGLDGGRPMLKNITNEDIAQVKYE
ncbi:MAG: exodeoxyribonuclease V subunit gamma [Clostridia bacterium]|nr:exodeoxyribonuclease V subunit gamma [Clostridia bacterium]